MLLKGQCTSKLLKNSYHLSLSCFQHDNKMLISVVFFLYRNEMDSKKSGKGSFAFAWVLDETEEERSRYIKETRIFQSLFHHWEKCFEICTSTRETLNLFLWLNKGINNFIGKNLMAVL